MDTANGSYKRPVTKLALQLSDQNLNKLHYHIYHPRITLTINYHFVIVKDRRFLHVEDVRSRFAVLEDVFSYMHSYRHSY